MKPIIFKSKKKNEEKLQKKSGYQLFSPDLVSVQLHTSSREINSRILESPTSLPGQLGSPKTALQKNAKKNAKQNATYV